jgi:hypothetical protein
MQTCAITFAIDGGGSLSERPYRNRYGSAVKTLFQMPQPKAEHCCVEHTCGEF